MTTKDEIKLNELNCKRNQAQATRLDQEEIDTLLGDLHQDWITNNEQYQLVRAFRFKGYAKALQTANVIAWLGDQQGHHPDINFGWGYCVVKFSTHEIDGLSINDFICAAKVDVLMAS